MRKLALIFSLILLFAFWGCGKKEPAPAPTPPPQPEQQVKAEPTPEPAVVKEEVKPTPVVKKKVAYPPGTYTIQVAAWETREDANKLASFYERKGYQARVEDADLESGRWYRVRIGRYDGYNSARDVADTIVEKYKSDVWLVRL
ncbi:MAG TPA: SPOR domain-containing protein [archaeon]|nr:SPOR domain-containing protein [archaeon]